jgi:hypothetical protein
MPACTLLDTDEFLYEKFLDHNRKKDEYNCLKLSDPIGEKKSFFSQFHIQWMMEQVAILSSLSVLYALFHCA